MSDWTSGSASARRRPTSQPEAPFSTTATAAEASTFDWGAGSATRAPAAGPAAVAPAPPAALPKSFGELQWHVDSGHDITPENFGPQAAAYRDLVETSLDPKQTRKTLGAAFGIAGAAGVSLDEAWQMAQNAYRTKNVAVQEQTFTLVDAAKMGWLGTQQAGVAANKVAKRILGQDTTKEDEEIAALQAKMPTFDMERATFGQKLLAGVAGLPSFIIDTQLKGMAAGGIAAIPAILAGAVIPGAGVAIPAMFMLGMEVGKTAEMGRTFLGQDYMTISSMKGENGQPLPDSVAIPASIIAAALQTGLANLQIEGVVGQVAGKGTILGNAAAKVVGKVLGKWQTSPILSTAARMIGNATWQGVQNGAQTLATELAQAVSVEAANADPENGDKWAGPAFKDSLARVLTDTGVGALSGLGLDATMMAGRAAYGVGRGIAFNLQLERAKATALRPEIRPGEEALSPQVLRENLDDIEAKYHQAEQDHAAANPDATEDGPHVKAYVDELKGHLDEVKKAVDQKAHEAPDGPDGSSSEQQLREYWSLVDQEDWIKRRLKAYTNEGERPRPAQEAPDFSSPERTQAAQDALTPDMRQAIRDHWSKLDGSLLTDREMDAAAMVIDYRARVLGKDPGDYVRDTFAPGVFESPEESRRVFAEELQRSGTEVNASVRWLQDGKAIIAAAESTDFKALVHEFAHVFVEQMDERSRSVLETFFGGDNERMAEGFVGFLKSGLTEHPDLVEPFQVLSGLLKQFRLSFDDVISPEIKKEYDDLLGGRPATAPDSTGTPTATGEAPGRLFNPLALKRPETTPLTRRQTTYDIGEISLTRQDLERVDARLPDIMESGIRGNDLLGMARDIRSLVDEYNGVDDNRHAALVKLLELVAKGNLDDMRVRAGPGNIEGLVYGRAAEDAAKAPEVQGPDVTDEVVVPERMYNVRELPEWEGKVRKWMEKNGYAEDEIKKFLEGMRGQLKLYEALGPYQLELFPKSAGIGERGPLRTNEDAIYRVSFDASSMCVKRLEFSATLAEVSRRLKSPAHPNGRMLTNGERIALITLFKQAGKAAPCLYCYVEAPRGKAMEAGARAIDIVFGRKEIPPAAPPGQKPRRASKANPVAEWSRAFVDLAKAAQKEAKKLGLKEVDPRIYTDYEYTMSDEAKAKIAAAPDVYKFVAASYLSAKSNLVKPYEAYAGQILRLAPDLIQELNRYAGFRFFSSSDFQAEHLVDLMQAIGDLSLMEGRAHSYTKVTDFVEVMANTGMKINMSLFAHYDEATGKITADTWQGMKWEDAKRLRKKSPNVGTVLVGSHDKVIEWALNSPWIDYIIPYHASSLERKFSDAAGWMDYSGVQNEEKVKGYVRPRDGKYEVLFYGEVEQTFDTRAAADRYRKAKAKEYERPGTPAKVRMHELGVHEGATDAEMRDRYFEICRDRGLEPVFPQWSDHPNYAKLKKDYARTDTPFEAVRPDFDQKAVGRITEKVLSGDIPKAKVDSKIAADLVKRIRKAEKTGVDIGVEAMDALRTNRAFNRPPPSYVVESLKQRVERGIWMDDTLLRQAESEPWAKSELGRREDLRQRATDLYESGELQVGDGAAFAAKMREQEVPGSERSDAYYRHIWDDAKKPDVPSAEDPNLRTLKKGRKATYNDGEPVVVADPDAAAERAIAAEDRVDARLARLQADYDEQVREANILRGTVSEMMDQADSLARGQAMAAKSLSEVGDAYTRDMLRAAMEAGDTKRQHEAQVAALNGDVTEARRDYTVAKLDIMLRNAKDLADALITGIMKPSSIATKWEQRKALMDLQSMYSVRDSAGLEKVRAKIAEWQAQNPGKALPPAYHRVLQQKSLRDLTIPQLRQLYEQARQIRKDGAAAMKAHMAARRARRLGHVGDALESFPEVKAMLDSGMKPLEVYAALRGDSASSLEGKAHAQALRGESPTKEGIGKAFTRAWINRRDPIAVLEALGPGFKKLLWDAKHEWLGRAIARAAEGKALVEKALKDTDITMEEICRPLSSGGKLVVDSKGNHYATYDVMDMYLLMKNDKGRKAVLYGNDHPEADVKFLISQLTPEQKALADRFQKIVTRDYADVQKVQLEEDNTQAANEPDYWRMQRYDDGGAPFHEALAEDAAIRMAAQIAKNKSDFTMNRVFFKEGQMQPRVRTDLPNILLEDIFQHSRYIESEQWNRDMRWLFGGKSAESKMLREAIRQKWGNEALRWIEDYISVSTRPEAFRAHQQAGLITRLIRQQATTGLMFNVGVAMLQLDGPARFLGEMGPLNPRDDALLTKNIIAAAAPRNKLYERMVEKSPIMRSMAGEEAIDPLLADGPRYKEFRGFMDELGFRYERFKKDVGFYPLRAMQKWTVTAGWNAVYDINFDRSMEAVGNDSMAIKAADDAVFRTQTSSHLEDSPRIYWLAQKDTFRSLLLMMSRDVNKQAQRLFLDMPKKFVQGRIDQVVGMVAAAALSSTLVAVKKLHRFPADAAEWTKAMLLGRIDELMALLGAGGIGADAVAQAVTGRQYSGRLEPAKPLYDMARSATTLLKGGDPPEKQMWNAVKSAAAMAQVPLTQAERAVNTVYDFENEEFRIDLGQMLGKASLTQ